MGQIALSVLNMAMINLVSETNFTTANVLTATVVNRQ